jgi:hypothetical protein
MAELPSELRKMLEWMRRLIDGMPHLYAGLQKISGENGPDSGDDFPPVAVVPAAPNPIVPAADAASMAAAESPVRPSLNVSISQIVRNAFDKKGSMTTNELFAYLEKTGMMTKVRESCGDQARNKVKKVLYELKKQEFITRADAKAATPWVPTPDFYVRQNHLKSIGDVTPPIEENSLVVEPPKEEKVEVRPEEPAQSSASAGL